MAFGRPLFETLLGGEQIEEWTFSCKYISMGVVGLKERVA